MSDFGKITGALLLLTSTLPLNGIWHTGIISGGMCLWALCLARSKRTITWQYADIGIAGYAIWSLLNACFREKGITYFALQGEIEVALWYFLARFSGFSWKILGILAMTGLFQGIWGLLQYVGILSSPHAFFPMTGIFGNPGPLAGFLVLTTLALTSIGWIFRKHPFIRIACMAGALLLGSAMYFADSRAAWLALFASIICFISLSCRIALWRRTVLCAGIACLLGTGIALYGLRTSSADGRLLIWKASGSMWTEHPLAGQGPGSFEAEYMPRQARYLEQATEKERMMAGNNYFAFNEPLRIACEAGSIGVLLLGGVLFFAGKVCVKHFKRPIVRIAGTLLAAVFVFSCFSYPMYFHLFRIWTAILLAMLAGYGKGISKTDARKGIYGLSACCLAYTVISLNIQIHKGQAQHAIQNKELQALEKHASHLCSDPDFTTQYGYFLFQEKAYQEAASWLSRAVQLRPTTSTLCRWGLCLESMGKEEEALKCYETAECMVPGLMRPAYLRFDLFRRQGRNREALTAGKALLNRPVKLINSETLRMKSAIRHYLSSMTEGDSSYSGKGGESRE